MISIPAHTRTMASANTTSEPNLVPSAVLRPASVAWQGTRLSGSELNKAIGCVAAVLAEHGVKRDDVVAVESDDSGRTVITLMALAALDCSVVFLRHAEQIWRGESGSRCATGATHLVVFRDVDSSHEKEFPQIDLRPVLTDIERGRADGCLRLPSEANAWFERSRALGVFSSGTVTGIPELVWKSGAELRENALATVRSLGYQSTDVLLPLLPLSGQYGSSVVIIAWVIGAGLVTSRRHRLGEVLRMIQRCEVTAVDAPPLVYRGMLDELRRRPGSVSRLSGVRIFGVGGEVVSELLMREFHEETGHRLVDGYGLTQLGNVAFGAPATPEVLEEPTRHRILQPVDTFRISVVDDEGMPVVDGVTGRILIGRADGRPVSGQELWFDTGDLGYSERGGVVVAGRQNMAMRNGSVIPFAWIESRLAQHGIESYMVAVPGAASTRIWLMIHDPLHRSRDHWRQRIWSLLDSGHRPDVIQILGTVPVEDSGKVSRRRLAGLAVGLQNGRGQMRRERMSALGRLRSAVMANRQELMQLVEQISDLPTAQHDFRAMLNVLDMAEGELNFHTVPERIPVDVFMARNALLESFAIYCLVPSLWARRIRVRPASGTQSIIRRLVELLRDLCPATLDFHDEAQKEFVARVASQPSVVLFTGHRSNAEDVLSCLTKQHLFLYFGRGVNPVVVFPDADLERASKEIVYSRLYNGGQDCLAPDIVLVHQDRAEQLEALLSRDVSDYVAASGGTLAPLSEKSDLLGAVCYLTTHARGLVSGGALHFQRGTFDPAVIRVDGEAKARPCEHFSPIISVATFTDEDEITTLLHSEYYRENGFGTAVYGGTEAFAYSQRDIGLVSWGQSLVAAIAPFEPFGGNGVESGFVHHLGRRVLGPINITQAAVRWGSSIKEGK